MKVFVCKLLMKFVLRNQFDSTALRNLFVRWFNIDIGLYSYGCFDLKRIPKGTKIGRYCSFSPTCYIFSRNHGVNFITTHPYIYNSFLGVVSEDTIENSQCVIGDDVWIGHNCVILPSVSKIGRGAIIAAGSVVTKNVPSYAIVAGNPAQVKKFRFDESVIFEIEKSKWWLLDKYQLKESLSQNHEMYFNPEGFYEK